MEKHRTCFDGIDIATSQDDIERTFTVRGYPPLDFVSTFSSQQRIAIPQSQSQPQNQSHTCCFASASDRKPCTSFDDAPGTYRVFRHWTITLSTRALCSLRYHDPRQAPRSWRSSRNLKSHTDHELCPKAIPSKPFCLQTNSVGQ